MNTILGIFMLFVFVCTAFKSGGQGPTGAA
jgi:hypothetical protein